MSVKQRARKSAISVLFDAFIAQQNDAKSLEIQRVCVKAYVISYMGLDSKSSVFSTTCFYTKLGAAPIRVNKIPTAKKAQPKAAAQENT